METSADRQFATFQKRHQSELKKCIDDSNAWKAVVMNEKNIEIQKIIQEKQNALEEQKKVMNAQYEALNKQQQATIQELKEQIKEIVHKKDKLDGTNKKLENEKSKLSKDVSKLELAKKEIKEELKDCVKKCKQNTSSAPSRTPQNKSKQNTKSAPSRTPQSKSKQNTKSETGRPTPQSKSKQNTKSKTARPTPQSKKNTKPTCEELFENGLKKDFSNVTITIDNKTWNFPQDKATFDNLVSQINVSDFKTLLNAKDLLRLKRLTHPDTYHNKCGDAEENKQFISDMTEIVQYLN